jgi:putative transposase
MLFRGKYRIPSARWATWDYRRAGWYFVTICTREKRRVLGEVVEGEMKLSPLGRLVAEEWEHTVRSRPGIEMDEWVVMPNHLHLIVRIVCSAEAVEARAGSLKSSGLKGDSLGAIIGQFKAACTRRAWGAGYHDFAWQARFFEHVIRNQSSLEKVRDYIRHNPQMWPTDRDNIENM